jgi:hypothetical protein
MASLLEDVKKRFKNSKVFFSKKRDNIESEPTLGFIDDLKRFSCIFAVQCFY